MIKDICLGLDLSLLLLRNIVVIFYDVLKRTCCVFSYIAYSF